jgi:uncharacterized delta-60 repeat protein
MAAYLGTDNVGNVKLGLSQISSMYLGSTQFWPTTSSTPNFGTGFGGSGVLAQQDTVVSGGKLYANYGMSSYSGSSIGFGTVRINVDGTLDTTWDTGTGFNEVVDQLTPLSNGQVMCGGSFSRYNGSGSGQIIRLNNDGTRDFTFPDVSVNNIAFWIGETLTNKYIVGGNFDFVSGSTANRIIGLNNDGTIDPTFNTGTGFNSTIIDGLITSTNKIVLGGFFTAYNGDGSNRIIKLNDDGTKDTSFNIGSGFNAGNIQSLWEQNDGKILAVGTFTNYSGSTANRIVRINLDGTKDPAWIGCIPNNTVQDVCELPNGKIVIVGDFTLVNGISRNKVAVLLPDGTLDLSSNIGTGINGEIYGVTPTNNSTNDFVVVGNFTEYDGISCSRGILKLNEWGFRLSI